LITAALTPADPAAAASPAAAPSASPVAGQVLSAPEGTAAQSDLAATSASHDPSEPHGFLDDSTTGPVRTGVQPAATGTPALATGFSSSVIFAGLDHPSAVRFASDGSVWVILKTGKILRYSNITTTTPTVFADLSAEVNSYWDRGLMGLALSPTFPADPSVYVLYTYDYNPVHDYMPSAPSQWNDNCPSPPGALTDGCPILGRLAKLTGNAGGATWSGTENVLVQGWCQQGPSHAMDDLAFGPDGYLYASAGEGDMFNVADYGQMGGTTTPIVTPANPCGDPPSPAGTTLTSPTAEGGMLRAQSPLRTDGPTLLSGTLLRVNPSTGAGVAGNPFASSSDANAKKILAYGLRNPFRFTFRPGFNNQVWLGDVGNAAWEEIDKIPVPTGGGSIPATGNNFGWPCYEGNAAGITYGVVTINQCTSLVNSGIAVGPYYTYNHAAHVNASESCRIGSSSVSALAFYTGTSYPVAYRGALFFGDHSRDCIWAMLPDGAGNPDPTNIVPIVTGSPTASTYWVGPVDLQAGPNGDLFYVDLDAGTVNRLTYGLPTALIHSDVTSGTAPLAVHFDGAHSSDPVGGGLTYSWNVPGGTCDSLTSAAPTCSFGVGTWGVTLAVTDSNLAHDTSVPYTITSGDTPPVPVIDTIDGAAPPAQPSGPTPPPALRPAGVPAFWAVGDNITFAGHAADAQDGTEPTANLSWQLVMHHCPSDCHLHFLQTWTGAASGSVAAPDHDYPSYLELILTATDAQSLSASTSIYLYPKTATLHIASSPTGLSLTVGDGNTVATPSDVTFIDGGAASLSAAPTVSIGGHSYAFSSWSDAGGVAHTVTAHNGDTYTANYVRTFPNGDTYYPVAPVRLLDTRYNNGISGKLVAGAPASFQITGRGGVSNVPAGATAVTANVTIVKPGARSSVYLGPAQNPHPASATINFNAADITAYGSTIAIDPATGKMSVTYMAASGTTDLVLDVTGYFMPNTSGDTYRPMTPVRLLDTRSGNGLKKAKVKANVPVSFKIWGRGGVLSSAKAVTGNLTVVNSTLGGNVYIGPNRLVKSSTSTINFAKGQVRANSLTVSLTTTGTLWATFMSTNGATIDLVFDVTGFYTAGLSGDRYVPITPAPYLDTRPSAGIGLTGTFSANTPRPFLVLGIGNVPSAAVGVTGIVSVYDQTNSWAVFVGPTPLPKPTTSVLNFVKTDNCSNGVTVALAPDGTLAVTYMGFAGNHANIEFVVTGYFVP
jgi:glucose/arabinose dehydrogenase